MKVVKTRLDLKNDDTKSNVILLGTWCIKNNLELLKNIKSYNVFPYHWANKDKFKKDYTYLDKIYEKKLAECTNILNEIHKTNKNQRYWRIVIGPWLRFFIDSLFDRYECIRLSYDDQPNSFFTLYNYEQNPPKDFEEFYEGLVSDYWNEIIFSECVKYLGLPHNISGDLSKPEKVFPHKKSFLRKIIDKSLMFYQFLISKLNNKIVIFSPYTSTFKTIRLQRSLVKFPFLITPEIKITNRRISESKRKYFIFNNINDDFEEFLSTQICKNIPLAYVENFNIIKSQVLKEYPRFPKVIFTANAYQSIESFKIWSAEMTSKNAKLFIGQHGGTFGLSLLNQTEKHQIKIADKFISWGWSSKEHKNVVYLPSLKLKSEPKKTFQRDNGKIIHVLGSVPRFFYNYFSMPLASEYIDYLRNQIIFLKKLNDFNLSRLEIRQDNTGKKWDWAVDDILKDHGFKKNISRKKIPLFDQLRGASLSVSTHNGTVPLETLALNFPTIIFWDKNHYQLRKEASQKVSSLKEVGIFYDCPKRAAQHINDIANNVSSWWYQENLQVVLKEFTREYALSAQDPVRVWQDFLLDESAKE